MKLVKFFLISVVVISQTLGQEQEMVFTEPEKLDITINSDSEEVYPILSPSGKSLYFVRAFHPENDGGVKGGQDIWYAERDADGVWGLPVNVAGLNSPDNNVVVGVSKDENTLYLLNTYSNPLRWHFGIAWSKRENESWGEPREMDLKFNYKGPLRAYYVTPNEDVIIMSSESNDTYGKEDLYIYTKEGNNWQGPIHLDQSINTPQAEISPFLSEDYQTMFFASEGHGGYGSFDIYMIKRQGESWDKWSKPENLGTGINTPGFEAYFSTHKDQETFFVSNREGKSTDIYATKMSFRDIVKPDTLEPAPVIQKPVKEDIVYTVQILAMPRGREPESSFLKKLDTIPVNIKKGSDGLDRFYVGEYPSLLDAFDAMEGLRNTGYDDAFVRQIEEYSSL